MNIHVLESSFKTQAQPFISSWSYYTYFMQSILSPFYKLAIVVCLLDISLVLHVLRIFQRLRYFIRAKIKPNTDKQL